MPADAREGLSKGLGRSWRPGILGQLFRAFAVRPLTPAREGAGTSCFEGEKDA